MRQIAFLVILLLSFGERKSIAAFRACDLDVWHVADLPGGGTEDFHSHSSSERRRIVTIRLYWLLVQKKSEGAYCSTLAYGARVRNG